MKLSHLKTKLLFIASMFIGSFVLNGQSSEGKDFWFSFMEHRDIGVNNKVVMITSETNTSGLIEIPFYNWTEGFTVQPNQVTLVELPSFTENLGSAQISDKGIHLVSNDSVSVYIHQYYSARSEATLVLPETALGTEYFIMSYRGVLINGKRYRSEFLIVGTEDETTIEITPSTDPLGVGSVGVPFTIFLNKGETYQLQADSHNGDLTGTHIKGDKNFAVFGGNSWTQIACGVRDNLLEQMYPVSTWGKQVVTVPSQKTNYDVYRIQASEDNTQVSVYDQGAVNPQNYTIDAGEFVEFQKSIPTYIISDKAIQVAQYFIGADCNGHFYGDPSMVLLNSVEQTRQSVTLYNSSYQNIIENYINLIVATNDLPFVEFDGAALPANAIVNSVGLNDEYSVVQLQVSAGSHNIKSSACGVIATAYGYGEVESYAYSGGASFEPINADPIPDGACLNDSIYFDTGLSENRYSFFWDLGSGVTSTESAFAHFYPDLGAYPVELIITDNCLGIADTINKDVLITLRQAVEVVGDTMVCEGGKILLEAFDLTSASFEWTGPNDFFAEEQFPVLQEVVPDMAGIYEVIGIISGCATFPEEVAVEINPNPTLDLGTDQVFCAMDGPIMVTAETFSFYNWQNGFAGQSLQVNNEGTYWLEVTDSLGCTARDTILIQDICPTQIYLPNVFTPNFDGINDVFKVYGNDIIEMHLQVIDRWGGLVFETKNPDGAWDGKVAGKMAEPGVYVWQLRISGYKEDGSIYEEVLSGVISLVI